MSSEGPGEFVLQCAKCETATLSTSVGSMQYYDLDTEPIVYTLVKCSKCGSPAVLVQDIAPGSGNTWDWSDPVRAWPSDNRKLSTAIPRSLRREAEEARSCYEAKAYTAAVVMVRRTLEGVCREHGVTDRPLQAALGKMHQQGHLDDRLLEWSQELRVLGNEGAHYTGQQVTRLDARDALDLAEAMLDYIYVLSQRFREFKQRRRPTASDESESSSQ